MFSKQHYCSNYVKKTVLGILKNKHSNNVIFWVEIKFVKCCENVLGTFK